MASTSASSIQKSFKYDVFLSFRGEDTRKNFVDHLYQALEQKSIYTYKDDEKIKKGKRISDEILRSIEDSRFYIIVFSKNYASSSWCLDELTKIMECQKVNGQTAYPVFYNVEPTEVRNQSGAVGDAFAKHKEEESALKWRQALREAADLAGWELKNTLDGHEAKFIQKIVQEISLELRLTNMRVDGKLVGMKKRVKDIVSALGTDIDDFLMIGIKGIGGGGKTTLARVVFDQLSAMFEGSSFVENVRECSKGPFGGLKSLQKQVLIDVLNDPLITINGVANLKNMMRKMMCGRKVLVVLDDVDHIDQLEALAGEPNWFKPGSRVIVTTRDEQVLVAHGVPKNLILDVNLLSVEEAICLFNRVLGSFLRGKDKHEWTDELELLKKIPLTETLQILELSYNSLEEYQKEIFLDVACILKGWEKERAIRVLESCGFHARIGLKVLEQKSLITVSDSGCLSMHDHIEEMGKNIVRRLHPDEPYKHSRLWIDEEIEDILDENKGTEETRCMKVNLVDLLSAMKGLRSMKKLRFLNVICPVYLGHHDKSNLGYKDIDEDQQYLPAGLRYLVWHGYPYKYLLKHFQAYDLVGLEMHFSNVDQLWKWEESKVLKKLRFIDLHSCKLRTLDIRLFPNLERLKLKRCVDLAELRMHVENFMLKYLNLSGSKLSTLDLSRGKNLDALKVKRCSDLVEIHMPVDNLNLKAISLRCSKLKTLNLTGTPNIEMLDLVCEDLIELHMPAESFKLKFLKLYHSKLRILDIGWAENLESFDIHFNDYLVELDLATKNLKSLWLRCPKLKTLKLMRTPNIEMLDLVCEDLVELDLSTKKLKSLWLRCPKMKTLNLTGTPDIEMLDLVCEDLVELHMPAESFKLKSFKLLSSKLRILDIGRAENLESFDILSNDYLVELDLAAKKLKSLRLRCHKMKTLNLAGTPDIEMLDLVCEDLVELDLATKKLKSLWLNCPSMKTLNLTGIPDIEMLVLVCEDLVELHMPAESFKLKSFELSYSKLRILDIGRAENLESFDILSNDYLVEHDLAAKKLKSLSLRCHKMKILNLTGTPNIEMLGLVCEDLVELHMPAESFKLKSFELLSSKLRMLDIGRAENLESFCIHSNDYLVELDLAAKKLKSLRLRCHKMKTLNLTGTPNIEMLDLVCEDLVELDLATKKLKSLRLRCHKMKTLNLTGTPNIEMLDLVCEDLLDLLMPDETPELKDIYISHSKLRSLDITQARNLEKLVIALCKDMLELHMPSESLELKCIHISCSSFRTLDFKRAQKLEKLYLLECGNLQEVHMPTESPELKIINISRAKLRTLNLKGTWNLEVLNVDQCEDLVEVHMPIESPQLRTINIHCSNLRTLQLGQGLYLESLDLGGCFNLEEIQAPVGCLSGSVRFKPLLVNQKFPVVGSSVELHLIVKSFGICPFHTDNNLPKFYIEYIYKELSPPSTPNLKRLISFRPCACTNRANLSVIIYGIQCLRKLTLEGSIREVPKDLDRLECLEELSLLSTNIECLPDAICMLKHLKFLQIKSCWNLKQLPRDLGRLECLEELHLTDCTSLRDIPNSICEMKRLKSFHLINCILVVKLPKEIGRLKCLKELNIKGTYIADLPDAIFELENLVL